MENYNITEAFKALDEVAEIELQDLEPKKSIFSLNDEEDVEELKSLMDIDEVEEEDPIEMIIDIDAEDEEELKDTYVGDVILQCNVCKSLIYKPEDQLVKDETVEDKDVFNVDEECPHCHKLLGYTLIGKVAPYDKEESEELQSEDEAGEDFEDEVFNSTEAEPAEDVDFEEEEEVEVKKESLEEEPKQEVLNESCDESLEKVGVNEGISYYLHDEEDDVIDTFSSKEKALDAAKKFGARCSVKLWDDDESELIASFDEKGKEIKEACEENLSEDTVKHDGKWVNKGEEGTHGEFKTKKEADAQRKAMFANGYKGESLDEEDGKKLNESGNYGTAYSIIDKTSPIAKILFYDGDWEELAEDGLVDSDLEIGFWKLIDDYYSSLSKAKKDLTDKKNQIIFSWDYGTDTEGGIVPTNDDFEAEYVPFNEDDLPDDWEDYLSWVGGSSVINKANKKKEYEEKAKELKKYLKSLEGKYKVKTWFYSVDVPEIEWQINYILPRDKFNLNTVDYNWYTSIKRKIEGKANLDKSSLNSIKKEMEKGAQKVSYDYLPMSNVMSKGFLEVESLNEAKKKTDVILLDHSDPDTLTLVKGAKEEDVEDYIDDDTFVFEIPRISGGLALISNNDENAEIQPLKTDLDSFKQATIEEFNKGLKNGDFTQEEAEDYIELYVNGVYTWGHGSTGEEYFNNFMEALDDSYVDNDSNDQMFIYDFDKNEVIRGVGDIEVYSLDEFINDNRQEEEISNDLTNLPPKAAKLAAELDKRGIKYSIVDGRLRTQKLDLPKVQKIKAELGIEGSLYESLNEAKEVFAIKKKNIENGEEKVIEVERVDNADLAQKKANEIEGAWVEKIEEECKDESCDEACKEECELKEGSKEIDRIGFKSLIKYDDPVFANAKYGVLNDGNFCYKFWAKDDEEAKKIFAERGVECESLDESLNETVEELDIKTIINNAKLACKRDGYNQVVFKDDTGYGFIRDYPKNGVDKDKIIGKVIGTWNNGIYTVKYVKESLDEEKCEECDNIKIEEIDENLFNTLVNNYIKEVYDNIDSYTTTGGSVDNKNNKVVLEGVIKFKSGKEQNTKFIFEEAKLTKKGKLKLKGINETFAKMKKAFTLQGSLKDQNLLAESFTYNYKVNSNNEVRRIYGTERIPMNEELKLISDISDYRPWAGAVNTYNKIVDAGMLDVLEATLEDSYPEGMTMTELNDMLWFDGDDILDMLGLREDEEDEEIEESCKTEEACQKEECELKEGSKEIDRIGFKSLIKYDDPVFAGASHGVLNDGNFVEKFWADSDEEAIKKFRGEADESCKEELEANTDFAMDQKVDKVFNELQDLAIEAKEKGEDYTADNLLDASSLLDDKKITEECKDESCELKEEADLPAEIIDEIHDTVDYFFSPDFKAILDEDDWKDFIITLLNEPAISEEGIANSFEDCSSDLRALLDTDKEPLIYEEAKRYLGTKMADLEEACKNEACEEELADDLDQENLMEDISSVVINQGEEDEIKLEAGDIKEVEVKEEDGKKVIEVEQEPSLEDLDAEPYLSNVEDEIEAEFNKGEAAPVEAPVEMIAPVEDEEAVSDEEASAEIEAEFNQE